MRGKNLEKIYLYSIEVEPCEEGGYFAKCPSLQGCHAEGDTYADVLKSIENVIKQHIKIRKQNKEFVPEITVRKKEMINVSMPVLVKC